MKLKAAIKSMRLRTLPLSTAGVLLGIMLAAADYQVSSLVAVLVVLTTVSLQVLSNLSNELGDVLHGTDTEERVGPGYGLNSGELSVKDMKVLIGIFVVLCMLLGSAMVYASWGTLLDIGKPAAQMDWTPTLVLLLGAGAIWAAMKYTLGRNPYGYRGLGDIYVFVFFGLVAVIGAYLVCAHTMFVRLLAPGAAVGFFAVGVLNVNNMRDAKTDAANRVTVAIKLGPKGARIYQTILIVMGWVCMVDYCLLRWHSWWHYLFVITLPLYIIHIIGVWKRHDRDLDPMLPLLVMSTFLFCLLAGFGFIVNLL